MLSMSAETADRLLSTQSKLGLRSISTTRVGALLKNQIPIHTFQDWNDSQPGFLEADLVSHCGIDIEGGYLYTAFAHRRSNRLDGMSSSPAPESGNGAGRHPTRMHAVILGIEPSKVGRRNNEVLIAYGEPEQMTFARGSPNLKNDQWFVNQKN